MAWGAFGTLAVPVQRYLFTVDGHLYTFKVAYYKHIVVLVFWWTYACISVGCVRGMELLGHRNERMPSIRRLYQISVGHLGSVLYEVALQISCPFLQGCPLLKTNCRILYIFWMSPFQVNSLQIFSFFSVDCIFTFGNGVFWWAEVLNYNIF